MAANTAKPESNETHLVGGAFPESQVGDSICLTPHLLTFRPARLIEQAHTFLSQFSRPNDDLELVSISVSKANSGVTSQNAGTFRMLGEVDNLSECVIFRLYTDKNRYEISGFWRKNPDGSEDTILEAWCESRKPRAGETFCRKRNICYRIMNYEGWHMLLGAIVSCEMVTVQANSFAQHGLHYGLDGLGAPVRFENPAA